MPFLPDMPCRATNPKEAIQPQVQEQVELLDLESLLLLVVVRRCREIPLLCPQKEFLRKYSKFPSSVSGLNRVTSAQSPLGLHAQTGIHRIPQTTADQVENGYGKKDGRRRYDRQPPIRMIFMR